MKVSIVIAVYNSESFIISCLDGLKAQTFRDFETILVVDSRSDDNSVNVCRLLAPLYSGIKVIIQDDDGRAGGARNIGLDAASGEYLWFLDVDDYFSECFLEEMVRILDNYNADIAVCNFFYSKERHFVTTPEKYYKMTLQDSHKAMLELNDGRYSTNLFNKLFRTEMLRDNNIRMTKRYCEDYEFLRDCFEQPCTVVYYSKPLYTYILSDGTRSSGEGNRIAEEDIRIFGETIQWAKVSWVGDIGDLYESGLTHILRSLTNADEECFLRLADSNTVRDATKNSGYTSVEIILFKISKRLFYKIGRNRRMRKFSEKEFLFDQDV